jgi:pantoate--beta-alanine ligase
MHLCEIAHFGTVKRRANTLDVVRAAIEVAASQANREFCALTTPSGPPRPPAAAGTDASSDGPHVVRTLAALRVLTARWRKAGESSAIIPTMGALHDGHMALVKVGQAKAKRTITSIFVNPTQFAPHEDFSRYPRDEAGDIAKLAGVGCDAVWAPSVDEMYRAGAATRIVPKGAALGLETDFRPHFFEGVATVCCKLFTQSQADFAIFGEKDYQQLCVVRQMVRDLDLPVEIVGMPTVREADGLAMSSRNRYLSPPDRQTAAIIHRLISTVSAQVKAGVPIDKATGDAQAALEQAGFTIDYVAVREADTMGAADVASGRALRVLMAGWLGKTRLIDNV